MINDTTILIYGMSTDEMSYLEAAAASLNLNCLFTDNLLDLMYKDYFLSLGRIEENPILLDYFGNTSSHLAHHMVLAEKKTPLSKSMKATLYKDFPTLQHNFAVDASKAQKKAISTLRTVDHIRHLMSIGDLFETRTHLSPKEIEAELGYPKNTTLRYLEMLELLKPEISCDPIKHVWTCTK